MFKVEGYTITFKRVFISLRSCRSGRYDTDCLIHPTGFSGPAWRGTATLHPKDRPDRIVGKKVALEHALKCSDEFFLKSKRTAIWKAFWQWVSMWPNSGK